MNSNNRIAATLFPRVIVCFRNTCINTLHTGYDDVFVVVSNKHIFFGEKNGSSNTVQVTFVVYGLKISHNCHVGKLPVTVFSITLHTHNRFLWSRSVGPKR